MFLKSIDAMHPTKIIFYLIQVFSVFRDLVIYLDVYKSF
nr:MAG TPA: hypothetical protein [Caudoviricetes sp.]